MKKFISTFVLLFLIGMVANGFYLQLTKEKKVTVKVKRLPCQAKVTSFERGYGDDDIIKAKKLLESGNFIMESGIDKAVYMESTLFNYVDIKKMDQIVLDLLNKSIKEKANSKEKITVNYKIYENDTEDPKKKSDNCKLFRGYVVMKFINSKNKTVYQSQIDFMDMKGLDIPQTIQCSVKAFLTYK